MKGKKTRFVKLRRAVLFSSIFLSATLALTAFAAVAEKETIKVPIVASPKGAQGWKLKEWKGKADFEVVEAEASTAFHLKSVSTSMALYKEVKFDIRDYPFLNWSWKAVELPAGGDVRKKSADDQAAQVYVVFPRWPAPVNSRIIGYIWDTTVPAGVSIQSTKSSYTKYIVVRGGNGDLNKWLTEKRNVYQDYKRLFKEDPPKVGSVSVMIDSDDTKTSAESFVGSIYFSK